MWVVLLSPFLAPNQRGGSKGDTKEEEEEEEAEDGCGTVSFIQANLQHRIAVSRVISRTVCVKGIYVAMTQELWYRKDRIMGLNITGYTLFSASGTDRPCTCILTRNEMAWLLPGFSCRDPVAVLIQYNKEVAE